jgi:hypothetical protein
MSELKVNKVTPRSGTTVTLGDSGDSVAIPTGVGFNGFGFRNIIINGDMSIAQRGTTITSPAAGAFLLDRFKYNENFGAVCTVTQSSDVPSSVGFINSMKIDITTAATPTAAEEFKIDYNVEGQHFGYIGYGTSAAKSLTLSFWVKSNVTGTYRVNFFNLNGTSNRIVGGTYTINSASTWEKKIITIPGDTAQATYLTNAAGFRIEFYLASGPDRTSGTLPTSWITYDDTRRVAGHDVNLADDTANEWYITGVQLEAGTTASDFEFLPIDVNLGRCQRYCNVFDTNNYHSLCNAYFNTTTAILGGVVTYPTTMRADPTVTYGGTTANFNCARAGSSNDNLSAITARNIKENSYELTATSANLATAFTPTIIYVTSDAKVTINAEL